MLELIWSLCFVNLVFRTVRPLNACPWPVNQVGCMNRFLYKRNLKTDTCTVLETLHYT